MKKIVVVLFVCLLCVTVSAFGEDLVPGTSTIIPERFQITFGFDIPEGAYILSCPEDATECVFSTYYWTPEESGKSHNAATFKPGQTSRKYFFKYEIISVRDPMKLTVAEPIVFK